MHIVVCVKQIPDTKFFKVNPKTNTLNRRSATAVLKPYGAHDDKEAVGVSTYGIVGNTLDIIPRIIKEFIAIPNQKGGEMSYV